MGAYDIVPNQVGRELYVALNLSDADLASMLGSVTVVGIFMENASVTFAGAEIASGGPPSDGTGLIAGAGDAFVVLPFGSLRTITPGSQLDHEWFGPAGVSFLTRAGQPFDGPYGALYATFGATGSPFYVGDGGIVVADGAASGSELIVHVNADADDLLGTAEGQLRVQIAQIPSSVLPREAAAHLSRVSHGGGR
jgi:hypothetical protein